MRFNLNFYFPFRSRVAFRLCVRRQALAHIVQYTHIFVHTTKAKKKKKKKKEEIMIWIHSKKCDEEDQTRAVGRSREIIWNKIKRTYPFPFMCLLHEQKKTPVKYYTRIVRVNILHLHWCQNSRLVTCLVKRKGTRNAVLKKKQKQMLEE